MNAQRVLDMAFGAVMKPEKDGSETFFNLLHPLKECAHAETVTVSGININGDFVTTTSCAICGDERYLKITPRSTE
jgi:hypothetical protein